MVITNSVSQKNSNIFWKINQKKIYKTEMFKISKVGLIMHSIHGWGSFCMNYCFNTAWHKGEQPVELIDDTYLPLDNSSQILYGVQVRRVGWPIKHSNIMVSKLLRSGFGIVARC